MASFLYWSSTSMLPAAIRSQSNLTHVSYYASLVHSLVGEHVANSEGSFSY